MSNLSGSNEKLAFSIKEANKNHLYGEENTSVAMTIIRFQGDLIELQRQI